MPRKFSRLLPSVGVLVLLACGASPAFADPILIQSGDPGAGQTETCNNIINSNTACVPITTNAAWQPNNPNSTSAVWISFGPTGAPPDNVTVPQNTTTPSMTVTYTFLAPPDAQFLGKVWADDTAGVYLDGLFLNAATLDTNPAANSTCQNDTPSCTPNGGYSINAFLGAGTSAGGGGDTEHTLVVTDYQVGDGTTNATNPFGVLFEGEASAVPEPATLALFGFGLLGAATVRRRLKSSRS